VHVHIWKWACPRRCGSAASQPSFIFASLIFAEPPSMCFPSCAGRRREYPITIAHALGVTTGYARKCTIMRGPVFALRYPPQYQQFEPPPRAPRAPGDMSNAGRCVCVFTSSVVCSCAAVLCRAVLAIVRACHFLCLPLFVLAIVYACIILLAIVCACHCVHMCCCLVCTCIINEALLAFYFNAICCTPLHKRVLVTSFLRTRTRTRAHQHTHTHAHTHTHIHTHMQHALGELCAHPPRQQQQCHKHAWQYAC